MNLQIPHPYPAVGKKQELEMASVDPYQLTYLMKKTYSVRGIFKQAVPLLNGDFQISALKMLPIHMIMNYTMKSIMEKIISQNGGFVRSITYRFSLVTKCLADILVACVSGILITKRVIPECLL